MDRLQILKKSIFFLLCFGNHQREISGLFVEEKYARMTTSFSKATRPNGFILSKKEG